MPAQSIFTIGITGHRDINKNDVDNLEKCIDSFLKEIKSNIPETKIRLTSLMADGADRIAAKIALQNEIPVDAILPMPKNIYIKDFDEFSLSALNDLISHDLVTLRELPLPKNVGSSDAVIPEIRSYLYARAGQFMASNSDLLIALWDGKHSEMIGGTYHIVKNTIQNINLINQSDNTTKNNSYYKSSLRDYKSTTIYHIPTTRKNNGNVTVITKKPSYIIRSSNENDSLTHVNTIPYELKNLFKQLNEYENDIKTISKSKLPKTCPLINETTKTTTIPNQLEDCLTEIEELFLTSDQLAIYFQTKSDKSFKLISFLAFFLGTLFLTYAKLFPNSNILIAYLVVFILGYTFYRNFKRDKILEKHVKYRVLAESLRVKYFFTISDIQDFIDGYTVDHYLKLNEHKDFRVLSNFIRNSSNSIIKIPLINLNDRIKMTVEQWVLSQSEYFQKKSLQTKSQIKRLEYINVSIILVGLLLICSLLGLPSDIKYFKLGNVLNVKSVVTFLVGFLPMAVATYEHYSIKMAISERAWQYETMTNIFRRATVLLQETSSTDEQQSILKALGEEAITENMNWMVLRLQRELQPATGG